MNSLQVSETLVIAENDSESNEKNEHQKLNECPSSGRFSDYNDDDETKWKVFSDPGSEIVQLQDDFPKLFEHFLVVGASPEKAADAAKKMESENQSFTSKMMKRIGDMVSTSNNSKRVSVNMQSQATTISRRSLADSADDDGLITRGSVTMSQKSIIDISGNNSDSRSKASQDQPEKLSTNGSVYGEGSYSRFHRVYHPLLMACIYICRYLGRVGLGLPLADTTEEPPLLQLVNDEYVSLQY